MAAVNVIDQYTNAGSALRDSIKTLRTNISFSSVDEELKTIVVTSVTPHEGKSTMAIFLGIAMAESLQRTLLVECDCRRPMLQNYLKLRPQFTLIDVLSRHARLEDAIVPSKMKHLDLLSSSVLANPVEVLGSTTFQKIISDLKKSYDIIILDTPPLGSFIEPAILASKADGTVVVIQSGTTDAAAAQSVVAQLEKAKARILGVVLNGVEASAGDYYYYNYYEDGGKKKKKHEKQQHPAHQKGLSQDIVAASKTV